MYLWQLHTQQPLPAVWVIRGTQLNSDQRGGGLKYHFRAQLVQTLPRDLLSLLLPAAEQENSVDLGDLEGYEMGGAWICLTGHSHGSHR